MHVQLNHTYIHRRFAFKEKTIFEFATDSIHVYMQIHNMDIWTCLFFFPVSPQFGFFPSGAVSFAILISTKYNLLISIV